LLQKAYFFREYLEKYFIDPMGILRYNINYKTMKPFSDKELSRSALPVKECGKAAYWTYEDTWMCTGMYLWALAEEYNSSGNQEVRELANRSFDSLCILTDTFDKHEKGFICKPWGGKLSDGYTLDQTFYLTLGLHVLSGIADKYRQLKISEIICSNADWWYKEDSSGKRRMWLMPGYAGPMLVQFFLAYLHSGKDKYWRICRQLVDKHNAFEFPVRFSKQWTESGGECRIRREALWHIGSVMALWLLIREWPDEKMKEHFKSRILDFWRKEINLGMDYSDGLVYHCVKVNERTDEEMTILPQELSPLSSDAYDKMTERMRVHLAKSAYFSANIAFAASLIADALPEKMELVKPFIICVLRKVNIEDMRWRVNKGTEEIFPEKEFLYNSLTSKGITPWLCCYWMSRRIGIA
jgi:hypothetical protein